MNFPPMYKNLVALDTVRHRQLRMKPNTPTLDPARDQNSMYLNVAEFGEAAHEYPIVFVRTSESQPGGAPVLAPVAVFGLVQGENLFIEGERWLGTYAPAYLRRYPFAMARMEGSPADKAQLAVCMDDSWPGFSDSEGDRLFDDEGKPTELAKSLLSFLETFEAESERTQQACKELAASGILEDMRFEAQFGEGAPKVEVTGFLAVNNEKLAALPDEQVLAWHRNGLMTLIELHRFSMANMGRLAAKRNAS